MESSFDTQPDSTDLAVELDCVSKRFGGTQALDGVSVGIREGEIHAFVGENGAGKSTLGKIIGGLYAVDSGDLRIAGQSVKRWNSSRAQREGVVMIAQEISLVPHLTVEQNVFLGIEENVFGIMKGNLSERLAKIEETTAFGIDPKAVVDTLRIADLQKVEIMRALARNARVIVMDEPTSSLTSHETNRLHELILQLRSQGKSIIYVSHYLDSVIEVSDRITIMRDGKLIRTSETRSETKNTIVSAMLGRDQLLSFPERAPTLDDGLAPILSVDGLAAPSGIHDVTLAVRPGEIVGLLGLVGSGRTEIARAIVGADPKSAGVVTFQGETVGTTGPRASMMRGMIMVPEDRHTQGLVLVRSVRENASMAFLDHFARWGFLRRGRERSSVTEMVSRLQVRPVRIELPIGTFSGGNQQKVLLAKWLIGSPAFVILDEPTRGVDVGAKLTIYELIIELAQQGVGVLLISSEHEEVLALSHRAYLVSRGTIIGEVNSAETTVESVLHQLFAVDDNQQEYVA
jgi:simple sugar transport system ATP-binding protein/ribose transport system ATP-binding protein